MQNGVSTPDDVGSFYDGFADMLVDLMGDSMHMGYWSGPDAPTTIEGAADRMTDMLIAEMDVAPGGRVLDVGSGTGRPAVRLAQARDVEVVGVTISRTQVEIATERAATAGLSDRVRFQYANAMELPFEDGSFDAAWALESLLHMPDRLTVLRETARVLRPGGRLVLADPVLRSPDLSDKQRSLLNDFYDMFKVVHIPPVDAYPALVRDAGFQFDKLIDVGDHTDRYKLGPSGWRLMAEGLRRNSALTPDKYGMSVEQHDDFLTRMANLENLPDQGYLLVSAHSVKAR